MIKRSLMVAALLAVSTVALAHHSFAMFDMSRRETVHGWVKNVEWTNPHVWIWVVTREGGDASSTYGFEMASPAEITRTYGWSRTSLKVGDEVTVEYCPLRSGKSGGALASAKLPNGQVLLGTAHFVPTSIPGKPGADAKPGTDNHSGEQHGHP